MVSTTCANCEQQIGKLEASHQWQGQTVCAECLAKLRGSVGTSSGRLGSDRLGYAGPADWYAEVSTARAEGVKFPSGVVSADGAIVVLAGQKIAVAEIVEATIEQTDAPIGQPPETIASIACFLCGGVVLAGVADGLPFETIVALIVGCLLVIATVAMILRGRPSHAVVITAESGRIFGPSSTRLGKLNRQLDDIKLAVSALR